MASSENSNNASVPAVRGENTASGGIGVHGICATGHGVRGESISSKGVVGTSETFQGVFGMSRDNAGVVGESDNLHGVFGICHNPRGAGVFGTNDKVDGFGVQGINESGDGVVGTGRRGVVGTSETFQGVFGMSRDNSGVVGESKKMHGVFGICKENLHGAGVYGTNEVEGFGVQGVSKAGQGVIGSSETGGGVVGETKSPIVAAVAGFNNNPEGTGAAIYGKKEGVKGHAGFFEGNVHVTGNLTTDGNIVLTNADCAEDFDIADIDVAEPGTVMVLGEEGALNQSQHAYDKRVAGVISGAGDYKPGIVLDKRQSQSNRKPIALLGKVYCKVDASYAPIGVGDLLTTAPTPGHAMKATDRMKAFGAVIGKALRPLKEGQGMIPILIALQ